MFYNKKKLKILESELSCYKSDYNHLREFITTLINKNQEQQQRIEKVIDFIDTWEKYKKENKPLEVTLLDLLYIKEILGDKENE